MHVLGLDISSLSSGWAIIDAEKQSIVDYGTITNKIKSPLPVKLSNFSHELVNICRTFQNIKWVGIEDVYYQNVVTTKTLSKFSGIAYKDIFNNLNIKDVYDDSFLEKIKLKKRNKVIPESGIFMISPSQVMNFVGLKHISDRDQKKIEIQKWVNSNFKLDLKQEDNDITDAIAIAYGTMNKVKELV